MKGMGNGKILDKYSSPPSLCLAVAVTHIRIYGIEIPQSFRKSKSEVC